MWFEPRYWYVSFKLLRWFSCASCYKELGYSSVNSQSGWPTPPTSPGNMWEVQIIRPCQNLHNQKFWGETQESVFEQVFHKRGCDSDSHSHLRTTALHRPCTSLLVIAYSYAFTQLSDLPIAVFVFEDPLTKFLLIFPDLIFLLKFLFLIMTKRHQPSFRHCFLFQC